MHPIGLAAASSGLASPVLTGSPIACALLSAAGLGLILAGILLLD
ncbi:MAG: hypothetical protein WC943_14550 [Elusimicrobiota bacterium]|jgi:hypothetical protein